MPDISPDTWTTEAIAVHDAYRFVKSHIHAEQRIITACTMLDVVHHANASEKIRQ
jgi:hypothetical protein